MTQVKPVELSLPKTLLRDWRGIERAILEQTDGAGVLRWCISDASGDDLQIEATVTTEPLPGWQGNAAARPGPSVAISIVPTGVGCAIGGYAGDAGPATSLLATSVDYLITNPNAVNASDFVATPPNMLYCEGSIIDALCEGRTELYPVKSNRIGLIVEHATPDVLAEIAYVTDTCRAIHGVDIVEVAVTSNSLGGRIHRMPSGTYTGSLERTDELLKIAGRMVDHGATAIAICSKLGGVDEDLRRKHFVDGDEANPIGGLEACISHLICRHYGVPAAHAPIRNVRPGPEPLGPVDARAAGEVVSRTGLACVLVGLGYAPRLRPEEVQGISSIINHRHIIAVVAPATSLGGIPVLTAIEDRIPVIAVRDNTTINRADAEGLAFGEVIEVDSYLEACGVLQALQHGIPPSAVKRPLTKTVLT